MHGGGDDYTKSKTAGTDDYSLRLGRNAIQLVRLASTELLLTAIASLLYF
jgi:hypothetical protein